MIYLVSYDNYDLAYIYNDIDKSCIMIPSKMLEAMDYVESSDIDKVDTLRLRFCGFKLSDSNNSLRKNLCSYKIDGYQALLFLDVYNSGNAVFIHLRIDGINLDSVRRLPCNGIVGEHGIIIIVPNIMLAYILNLYSKCDFDALMRAFYDVVGDRIYMMVKNFQRGAVVSEPVWL